MERLRKREKNCLGMGKEKKGERLFIHLGFPWPLDVIVWDQRFFSFGLPALGDFVGTSLGCLWETYQHSLWQPPTEFNVSKSLRPELISGR